MGPPLISHKSRAQLLFDCLLDAYRNLTPIEQLLVLLHIAVAAVCGMAQGAAPRPLARRPATQ